MNIKNKLLLWLKKINGPYWIIWARRTLYSAPIFETFISISFILIRILFNETANIEYYFRFEAPFYDTGTMLSFLLCLEHLYVCYYLIIILAMVYWSLYICIIDFSGYSFKKRGFVSVFFLFFFKRFIYSLKFIYLYLSKIILKIILKLKELELLFFLYNSHIKKNNNFSYFNNWIIKINILNIVINYITNYDLLGRSYLILNYGLLKFVLIINILLDSISFLNKDIKFIEEIILKKFFFRFLYYSTPKSYFFTNLTNKLFFIKKSDKLSYNNLLIQLRTMYKDIFLINNFRHSGIFEGVWAAFPTFIIICILIPSLILLYSFEDILNPKLSIKVIGNQWYWTYEFDNWIKYKKVDNLNKSIEERNIYTNYAFDSVIIPQDNLIFGTKRLLEVDNRLVLPTNVTTRFLVSSSDVLHAFAVPELGFKVDAVPGRLNQILLFISRPGIYYGQCSELCGANHAFMPIVIQAVTPTTYLSYVESLQLKTDLRKDE